MDGLERVLKTFAFELTKGVGVFEQAVSGAVVSAVLGREALARRGGWIVGSSNMLLPGTNLDGYIGTLEVLRSSSCCE